YVCLSRAVTALAAVGRLRSARILRLGVWRPFERITLGVTDHARVAADVARLRRGLAARRLEAGGWYSPIQPINRRERGVRQDSWGRNGLRILCGFGGPGGVCWSARN